MIAKENIYAFLESNFAYLLVTDESGRIIYTSRPFADDVISNQELAESEQLKDLLTPFSWTTCQSAMTQARKRNQGVAVLINKNSSAGSVPMKVGYLEHGERRIFLFFGNKLSTLSQKEDWEKDERIKELTCIYNVAELIETSRSMAEFLTMLPSCLGPGMFYPEEAVVYSVYDGVEYGQKLAGDHYLSVKLTVWNQDRGEIRVGYHDESRKLLPEEQKLLDEIRRMLILALETRELKEKLSRMESKEAEYSHRLTDLTNAIDAQTQELDQQKKRLAAVNAYLSQGDYEWEKAKTRLETIFKAIPDEVFLLDTDRKVVMANREHVQPGMFCYASVFGRDKPCEDCCLVKILKYKTPVTLIIKEDARYLQVHALPLYNEKQEVDGILEFHRDVTIEKTYDQQLQQADKLASLGELVSGIGHEINNPNQFIRGNIKIVKQALEDMLPIVDEYAKSLPDLKIARLNYKFFRDHIMVLVDDMGHGSERIKSIVSSLRAFAIKDEGLLVDTVEINTLVEETTRFVYKEVHKRSEIVLALGEGLPPFKGNTQKIEQVLVDLFVNAGQAIPKGRKGLITVRTFEEDAHVVIQIEDNGCGMNEKAMQQIFDPFFTTKRGKGGTGLGLSIAYRIIKEHGGTITVASEPEVGTKFTIKIPAMSSSETRKG